MTKIAKPTSSKGTVSLSVTPTDIEALTAPNDKPKIIELVGPIPTVLAQASALCRLGFTISADHMTTMYAATGHAVIVLVPGDPEQAMVEAATQAMNDALARERHLALDAEERAVAAEKRRAEQAERDATKAAIEAQICAQQESLRLLQALLVKA